MHIFEFKYIIIIKIATFTDLLNETHKHINLQFHFILDARSCVTCDTVLAELEKIDDDTDSFGVDFVKINDKRLAKQYGIKTFPALTYFR